MDQPRIIRFLDHVSVAFALFAGLAVVILSLLICFDILARTFFRFSLQGTDELGGYTLALIGSLGLPYALLRRGHPRIDIFPAPMLLLEPALIDVEMYNSNLTTAIDAQVVLYFLEPRDNVRLG